MNQSLRNVHVRKLNKGAQLGDNVSTIIRFPKPHKKHPPQNEDELAAHAKQVQLEFVTRHCTDFAFEVFRMVESHGFDLSGPDVDKNIKHDMVLISEAIKSTLLRTMGQHHPLQEFAENVINLHESDIVFDDDMEEDIT